MYIAKILNFLRFFSLLVFLQICNNSTGILLQYFRMAESEYGTWQSKRLQNSKPDTDRHREKKPIRVSMVRPKTTIMIKCHSFSCDSVPLRPFVCTYVHFSYTRAPNGLFLEKGGGGIPSKTELRLLYLMRPRSHHIFCLLSRLLNMKIRLQKNVYIFLQPPEA